MKKNVIVKAAIMFIFVCIVNVCGTQCAAMKKTADKTEIQGKDRDEAEVYRAVIEEYELMLKSENKGFIPDKWKYVYNTLFYIGRNDGKLYYALADLSGDGYPELIVGRKWDAKNWGTFLYNELYWSYREEDVVLRTVEDTSTVTPYAVYFWGDNGLEIYTCDEYKMTIYESGVIELEKPYMRKYLEFQKDTGSLKCSDTFKAVRERESKVVFYRKEKKSDNFEEISKEEYIKNVNYYLSDMMGFEWVPVKCSAE